MADASTKFWKVKIYTRTRKRRNLNLTIKLKIFLPVLLDPKTAPSMFQNAIDSLLSIVKWQLALVHLDDVVIFLRAIEEHLDHIRTVLGILPRAGVPLGLRRCLLFKDRIEYFGHIL